MPNVAGPPVTPIQYWWPAINIGSKTEFTVKRGNGKPKVGRPERGKNSIMLPGAPDASL
jgi:hypothetical protein